MALGRRVCVRGIIYKDGKLFAQKLVGGRDYWCTPGGGLDECESLEDGLRREMIEETGVDPQIGNLLFIQQYRDEKQEYLEFFFHIKNADDYENINLAETTHGQIEIEHFGFIDPKSENILPKPLQTMDFDTYTSSNQPVVVMDRLIHD